VSISPYHTDSRLERLIKSTKSLSQSVRIAANLGQTRMKYLSTELTPQPAGNGSLDDIIGVYYQTAALVTDWRTNSKMWQRSSIYERQ
jgi:hypothetical protein